MPPRDWLVFIKKLAWLCKLAAELIDNCKKLVPGNINAECLEVKLACNLGVPSDGIPEAGSNMVKLPCLLKAVDVADLSLTIAEPDMVSLEKPVLLPGTDEGCFLEDHTIIHTSQFQRVTFVSPKIVSFICFDTLLIEF